jgi:hypothetical protein
MTRDLSVEERAAMGAAMTEWWGKPLDGAYSPPFEAGYRAALAAREEPATPDQTERVLRVLDERGLLADAEDVEFTTLVVKELIAAAREVEELPGDGQRPDTMSERSSQRLASEMHEAVTRADTAERNAEVLAKALDRFLKDDHVLWGSPTRDLRSAVEPTLQALGYGKD